MNGTWALVVGGLAVFGALAIAIGVALVPARRLNRLAVERAKQAPTLAASVAGWTRRAGTAADDALDRRGRRQGLEALLEQAGLPVRAGEALVLAVAAAAVVFLVGGLLAGPFTGIVLAGSVGAAARLVPGMLRDRRRARFAEQLPDLLQLLAGSLRSGHGLQQALETASSETSSPTADELRRVMAEVRLGRDLDLALAAVVERTASHDFGWVCQAIAINREIGGDLAEVLDSVTATVQSRAHVARQVKALSAEGRISAIVLLALPPGVAVIVSLSNPTYLSPFVSDPRGVLLVVVAGALMAAGTLWLRRLIRPLY